MLKRIIMLFLYVGTFVLMLSTVESVSSKICKYVDGNNLCVKLIEEKALGSGVLSYFPYGISQVLQVLNDRPWIDSSIGSFSDWQLPLLAGRGENFSYDQLTDNFLKVIELNISIKIEHEPH